jgi:hypothetical protein
MYECRFSFAAQHALAPDAAPLRFAAQVKRAPLSRPLRARLNGAAGCARWQAWLAALAAA